MITKATKGKIVEGLTERFKGATGFYFVNYQGMKVKDSIRLRRLLKKSGFEFKIAKNTLILRALNKIGDYNIPDEVFIGTSGIVFSYDDPVSPAKIIKEQFDKFQMPIFKGAYIDSQFFDSSKLKELASLPTKQDILAGIVGSLQAPASGIVGSINAVIRDLASLIEEVAKSKNAA